MGICEGSNGLMKDTCHVFVAEVAEQKEQQLDPTEEIELLYRRPDEVEKMVRNNEIWCGQTLASWALAYHYFLHED